MEDPRSEIPGVVEALTMAETPARLRGAVHKYFEHNASFVHPLCNVLPGSGSRETILGLYQWYRDLSPGTEAEVKSLVYDEDNKVAYIEVVQSVQIFLSPVKTKPMRLTTKLSLRQSQTDGKYYIAQQEDFVQPEDVLYATLPFLVHPLLLLKQFAAQTCCFNAAVFAVLRSYIRNGMTFVGMRERKGGEGENLNADKES